MRHRYVRVAALGLVLMTLWPSWLPAQERQPYTVDQLVQLIQSGVFSASRILTLTQESCLDFYLDERSESRLVAAGASAELIRGLRGVCVRPPRIVTGIRLSAEELEVAVGEERALGAQALGPEGVPISDIVFQWLSQDTLVAVVSGDGRVRGRSVGTTRVTARFEDGPVAAATIRVIEAASEAGAAASAAKSPAAAAALGVVIPGGGEFYAGNTVKGVAALAGAGAALAVGYFTRRETALSSTSSAANPTCDGGVCTIDVTTESEVEETRNIVIGAAVAGAVWALALVDGIMAAKGARAAEPLEARRDADRGIGLALVPADGVRFSARGELEITLVRVGL